MGLKQSFHLGQHRGTAAAVHATQTVYDFWLCPALVALLGCIKTYALRNNPSWCTI
jgi:hypothetical protein